MSYYQGDFYRSAGARYQGDPGFFSFLGGLAKKAVGFIPGVGPALSAATSLIPSGGSKLAKMSRAAGTVLAKHPVMTAAGAAALGGAASGAAAVGTQRLLRMHMGGTGRRHRRMRVTNPKALRRAIRRTSGFAKLAMRTIHIVHPRKKGRFGGFKRRARKAA